MWDLLKRLLKPVYTRVFAIHVPVSLIYSSAPPLKQRIPNVVYQTWKKPVLPLRHAMGIRRFRRLNRDYSFRFFDDDQMAEYMNRNYSGHPILKIFNDILIPAAKADVWRYCILFREGGIYCDIDSALAIPFRDLLSDNPSEVISFEQNRWDVPVLHSSDPPPPTFLPGPPDSVRSQLECPSHVVLNWLLCFERESPILAEVIDLIVRQAEFFRGRKVDHVWNAIVHFTGPLALTQAVWRWMQETGKRPNQWGIDFRGYGIFKLPGEAFRYPASPHFWEMSQTAVISRRGT